MNSPSRLFLYAVSLISASALGYEILLMRLFSIIQWQNFAYMMISLALLGYGASGTFLALSRNLLAGRFELAFTASAFLFGLTSLPCFLAAQQVPFNALEILWSPSEWLHLAAIYLLLIPPFFFAGLCLGLSYQHYGAELGKVYAADLIGGGAGCLLIIVLLSLFSPLNALRLVSSLGIIAASLAWLGLGCMPTSQNRTIEPCDFAPSSGPSVHLLPKGEGYKARTSSADYWKAGMIAAAVPLLWIVASIGQVELKPVEYKELSQTLQAQGAARLEKKSSPLGLLTVVENKAIPFRYAPGLSLISPGEVPEQLAVFTDGEGMNAINRYRGDTKELEFLDYVPSALPYHLLSKPNVLVLGAGGGGDVLQALAHHADFIDAVELNPQMRELVSHDYGEFSGHIYNHPKVRVHVEEARGFIAAASERYDLIQLALLDAFNASSAGLYALNESYVYTVEAFEDYLAHLSPGGLLAITRWVRLPPRDDLKLFATAIEALENRGIFEPRERLAWIRTWQTDTLLVKNGVFTKQDIDQIKAFCEERSFDTVWYPGIKAEEANVYNRLNQDYFHQAAIALLGSNRQSFIERYKFDIHPATDDKPYFFMFFKWPLLSELLEKRGAGGLSMLDMGYLSQFAALVQAALISFLLILAPLRALRQSQAIDSQLRRQAGVYFFAIGLAFMFTEIVYIQKFMLYLSHPLYAIAVVLAAFLLFAGAGSRYAASRRATGSQVAKAVGIIALVSVAYLIVLPFLFSATMGFPSPIKIFIVLGLIAPVAFFMGMPFPLGLSRLSTETQGLVPWVWGINGCASVIAAILAGLLSIHFGHTVVLLMALLLYGAAAASMRNWKFR